MTAIQYRARKTGKTALVNVDKTAELFQWTYPEGTAIQVSFPRNVHDTDPARHTVALASELGADVAELVVQFIASAVRRKEPLIVMSEMIRAAENVAWYAPTCIDEVPA